jgi:hypothetical protein
MNLKEIIKQHGELDLKITALEESISLIRSEFSSRDGVPPSKIVITGDGKRVPPYIFTEILNTLHTTYLQPLYETRDNLEEIVVDEE